MARFIKNRENAKGQVPGELVFIGKQKMEEAEIQLTQYDPDFLEVQNCSTIQEAFSKVKPGRVNWINIHGLHDKQLIGDIGSLFQIPSLILEDILNTDQRPKYIDGDNFDGFFLKMLNDNNPNNQVKAEQISVILGEHFVLTIQEQKSESFNHVRERIRSKKGRIRNRKSDYLTYALMDTIVDNYTIVIENIGSKVEELEDRIFASKNTNVVEEIYGYKTELNYLRKSVRPVKELMTDLLRTDNSFFDESNINYLKDLNDLVLQSTEAIELYNGLVSDQINVYNSTVSNGVNEVMKVLTIFASIFIPLTFIAGVYGMNFEYIPELNFKYSYLIFWIIVILIGGWLLMYFKRKKWF